jgi:hypothetical protein
MSIVPLKIWYISRVGHRTRYCGRVNGHGAPCRVATSKFKWFCPTSESAYSTFSLPTLSTKLLPSYKPLQTVLLPLYRLTVPARKSFVSVKPASHLPTCQDAFSSFPSTAGQTRQGR